MHDFGRGASRDMLCCSKPCEAQSYAQRWACAAQQCCAHASAANNRSCEHVIWTDITQRAHSTCITVPQPTLVRRSMTPRSRDHSALSALAAAALLGEVMGVYSSRLHTDGCAHVRVIWSDKMCEMGEKGEGRGRFHTDGCVRD